MKKFICIIISFLMTAVLLPSGFAYAEETLKASVGKTDAVQGSKVTLEFKIDKNPGITQFNIVVDYDKEILKPESVSKENTVFDSITFKNDGDILQAVYTDTTGNTSDGLIFSAEFTVSEAAPLGSISKVSMNGEKTKFFKGDEEVTADITDGSVRIICKDHSYSENEYTAPTCTESGISRHICGVCGYEETVTSQPLGHSVTDWTVAKEPTCSETGLKTGICSLCKIEQTEEVPTTEHTFGDWEISLYPTVSQIGEKTRLCTVCGYAETENVPKLVTNIIDPVSGAGIVGQGDTAFFATAVFRAEQTLFDNFSDEEQSSAKEITKSLVGKKIYSSYSLSLSDEDGQGIIFDGTASVALPVKKLSGAVLVGISGGGYTIINADISDSMITFNTTGFADLYYILCDINDLAAAADKDSENNIKKAGESEAPKGWIIVLTAAAVLLMASAAMVIIGIRHQKIKQQETDFSLDTDDTEDSESREMKNFVGSLLDKKDTANEDTPETGEDHRP